MYILCEVGLIMYMIDPFYLLNFSCLITAKIQSTTAVAHFKPLMHLDVLAKADACLQAADVQPDCHAGVVSGTFY